MISFDMAVAWVSDQINCWGWMAWCAVMVLRWIPRYVCNFLVEFVEDIMQREILLGTCKACLEGGYHVMVEKKA